MITEPVTGISFESPQAGRAVGVELSVSIQGRIAACTAAKLQQGGYLGDTEVPELLADYKEYVTWAATSQGTSCDFLHYLARRQAGKHGLGVESEVKIMHKLLRGRLNESVFYWSVGSFPSRTMTLYEQYPSVREVCTLLLCPAVYTGGDSIIHVTALNPVAGLVAAEWIRHDISLLENRDEPFVYPFMVDFPCWDSMQHQHFQP